MVHIHTGVNLKHKLVSFHPVGLHYVSDPTFTLSA